MEDLAMTDAGFWAGRRVLITGHTGFIGSWLTLALHRLGARIAGLALPPPTVPSHFVVSRIGDCLDHQEGDIRDPELVRGALSRFRPEIVLHLAAQPLVRLAYDEPVATFATNVMGTAHVLDAIRHTPEVRAAVVYTSDKVYANREWHWGYREIDPLGGHEPYGASKAATEHVVEAYARSYFERGGRQLGLAVLRAGNVIGGGDWAVDRLVPDAMRSFGAGRALHLRNPRAVRPWQHVLEPVRATLIVAQKMLEEATSASQPWNIGPAAEDMRPVGEIADRLVSLWPDAKPWVAEPGAGAGEAKLLFLDSAKAQSELGWKPRWRLDRALDETVAWYRAQHQGADMANFSRKQIEGYFDGR